MNFLAHSYFSPEVPRIRLGNTFGDFVKGRKMEGEHSEVREGVLLHREIDVFTDSHPAFFNIVDILRPALGRYAGIVVDLLLDHHLSKSWTNYSKLSLEAYELQLHEQFLQYKPDLNTTIHGVGKIMHEHLWLLKYATLEGMEEILDQMTWRLKNRPNRTEGHQISLNAGADLIRLHYDAIEKEARILLQDAIQKFPVYG